MERLSTITTTRVERRAALLAVERRGAGHAVARLQRGDRLAPRILDGDSAAVRACVLPTQAGPLSGDHDRLRIHVGAGATLVVRPVAATIAMPGEERIRLDLNIEVGRRGRLVLEEAPLIVAAGADVERSTTVTLAVGAVAVLRDAVVLGRAGEPGGRLVSVLRVCDEAGVVLHDELRLDSATPLRDVHVALAPGDRVTGTLCLLGPVELDEPRSAVALVAADEPRFALARAGVLRRAAAAGLAELEAKLAEPWARWARAVAPSTVTNG